jgi:hypothetical protein
VARVTALIGDLLFGSKAIELLSAAGHEARLAPSAPADLAATADVVVVDLTTGDVPEGVVGQGVKVLGVFAHVEPEVRERALALGYDLVVPRSRFMREGGQLVARLSAGATPAPEDA